MGLVDAAMSNLDSASNSEDVQATEGDQLHIKNMEAEPCQCGNCPIMDVPGHQKCCRQVKWWQEKYPSEGIALGRYLQNYLLANYHFSGINCLLEQPNFSNTFNEDVHK